MLVLEVVLIVTVLVLAGTVVYNANKAHNTVSQSVSGSPSPASAPASTPRPGLSAARKTIEYNGASFSVELPEGWGFKELPPYGDEKQAIITDPGNQLSLTLQIMDYTGSVSSQPYERQFVGIGGRPYYLCDSRSAHNSAAPARLAALRLSRAEVSRCSRPSSKPA